MAELGGYDLDKGKDETSNGYFATGPIQGNEVREMTDCDKQIPNNQRVLTNL